MLGTSVTSVVDPMAVINKAFYTQLADIPGIAMTSRQEP